MTQEQLIEGLNSDLAGEYQAVLMYVTYAASVSGPYRPILKPFFEGEITEELAHAQFVANKIASLGGNPTTEPRAVPAATDAREMLANIRAAEERAIADYRRRAKEAAAFGDSALVTHLESIVEDETGHLEETEKILRGW